VVVTNNNIGKLCSEIIAQDDLYNAQTRRQRCQTIYIITSFLTTNYITKKKEKKEVSTSVAEGNLSEVYIQAFNFHFVYAQQWWDGKKSPHSSFFHQSFSSWGGCVARRNQVLNALNRWGQSSTFLVKLRHCCNNSCASDKGSVEMILRNVSSSSIHRFLLLESKGEWSLLTSRTGSQCFTNFFLTWEVGTGEPGTTRILS